MKTTIVRRLGAPLLALVALLLALSGCGPRASKHARRRGPLRVSYSHWAGYFPPLIAKEKGFFAQQGVDVEPVFARDVYAAMSDFTAGEVDMMPWPLLDIVHIFAQEPDSRVVLWSGSTAGADFVMAQPEIKKVADLKGKRVAGRLGTLGEMFIGEMLARNGLAIDDVTLIDTSSDTDVVEFLRNRTVEAGYTWEPHATEAKKHGARELFSSQQIPLLFSDFMLVRGSVLRERPEDVRAFIRAWFQAVEYWQAHVKEGNEIIAKAMNVAVEEVTLEGYQQFSLADVQRMFAPRNDPTSPIVFAPGDAPTSLLELADKHIDFLVQDGQLGHRPDVRKMFDSSFLPPAAEARAAP
jgi:NitT/TauT family transport system substrate-binding protein